MGAGGSARQGGARRPRNQQLRSWGDGWSVGSSSSCRGHSSRVSQRAMRRRRAGGRVGLGHGPGQPVRRPTATRAGTEVCAFLSMMRPKTPGLFSTSGGGKAPRLEGARPGAPHRSPRLPGPGPEADAWAFSPRAPGTDAPTRVPMRPKGAKERRVDFVRGNPSIQRHPPGRCRGHPDSGTMGRHLARSRKGLLCLPERESSGLSPGKPLSSG